MQTSLRRSMKKKWQSPIVSLVTIFSIAVSMCSGILLTDRVAAQTTSRKTADTTYIRNLTTLAREGRLEPGTANAAVKPVIDILSKGQHNNPVLISESSFNTNAIVQRLAQRIVDGNVPENLRNSQVFALDVYGLFKGASAGDIESRVRKVVAEVTRERNAILFVDELHQFLGERATGQVTATLKNAIAESKLRVIGSTSRAAYNNYIASDALLDVLFK